MTFRSDRGVMKYRYTAKGCEPRPVQSGAGAVLGRAELKDFLCIRVAGNEQKPLDFSSDYVKAARGPIKTFDYALENDQDNWAIERKALGDFISSVTLQKNWLHELAKITRAKEWGLPIIYVLEFSWDDIATYDYSIFKSGNIDSPFIYRRVSEMEYNYNVHMDFRNSREGAAYAIALLLKRRHEQLRQESFKMNSKRQADAES